MSQLGDIVLVLVVVLERELSHHLLRSLCPISGKDCSKDRSTQRATFEDDASTSTRTTLKTNRSTSGTTRVDLRSRGFRSTDRR